MLFQGGYTFRLLYLKGRLKNFDLVIFYFYAMVTLLSNSFSLSFLAALVLFLSCIIKYPYDLYDFLTSFLAYTYACAGISYLSNLLLIILIDMGKHRLLYSDARLRKIRTWVHVVVGLLDFAIILYFFATFFLSLDKEDSKTDHTSVAVLYFFVSGLICIVNIL